MYYAQLIQMFNQPLKWVGEHLDIEVDHTALHENGKFQKNIALIDCTHNPVICSPTI